MINNEIQKITCKRVNREPENAERYVDPVKKFQMYASAKRLEERLAVNGPKDPNSQDSYYQSDHLTNV